MRHEVVADARMTSGGEGNLELRAHPVRARDEHGLFVALGVEPKEPAKAADIG